MSRNAVWGPQATTARHSVRSSGAPRDQLPARPQRGGRCFPRISDACPANRRPDPVGEELEPVTPEVAAAPRNARTGLVLVLGARAMDPSTGTAWTVGAASRWRRSPVGASASRARRRA